MPSLDEYAKVYFNSDCLKISRRLKQINTVATYNSRNITDEQIIKMVKNGLNVIRINMSHTDKDSTLDSVLRIQNVMNKNNLDLNIMLDTKGPEIRTSTLKQDQKLNLKKDNLLKVYPDYSIEPSEEAIGINFPNLLNCGISKGDLIFMSDGNLVLVVEGKGKDHIITRITCDFQLGSRKNVGVSGYNVDLSVLTKSDEENISHVLKNTHIDSIAVSFVQSKEDLMKVREFLAGCVGKEKANEIYLVSKVESAGAMKNIDEIIEETDVIMYARGDLGMDMFLETLPVNQIVVTNKCNLAKKPIIIATQVLESMISNARPTRAEATDAFFAGLLNSDCLMLSGESANGKFPVESITELSKIGSFAASINYKKSPTPITAKSEDRINLIKNIQEFGIQNDEPRFVYTYAKNMKDFVENIYCKEFGIPVIVFFPHNYEFNANVSFHQGYHSICLEDDAFNSVMKGAGFDKINSLNLKNSYIYKNILGESQGIFFNPKL